MKVCKSCSKSLPLESFGPYPKSRDGLTYSCKPCLAEYSRRFRGENRASCRRSELKYKYGITPEQYDEMWKAQGEGCAICGSDRKPRIDHCHQTGRVRGILCDTCNRGLGMLGDNLETLRNVVQYLERG